MAASPIEIMQPALALGETYAAPTPPSSPDDDVTEHMLFGEVEDVDQADADIIVPRKKTAPKSGITIGKAALELYAKKHGFTYDEVVSDLETAKVFAAQLLKAKASANKALQPEIRKQKRAAEKAAAAARDRRLAELEARFAAEEAQ